MSILSFQTTRGPMPAGPDPSDVALEASVTHSRAEAVIAASWAMAEAWTGRWWWPVAEAVLIVDIVAPGPVLWPRWPYPAAVEVIDAFASSAPMGGEAFDYWKASGRLELPCRGRYQILATGEITPPAPGPHVVEAVRNLALYALVHSPARREFRVMNAGDSQLTRESTGPIMAASGAGALLSSEVRW